MGKVTHYTAAIGLHKDAGSDHRMTSCTIHGTLSRLITTQLLSTPHPFALTGCSAYFRSGHREETALAWARFGRQLCHQ